MRNQARRDAGMAWLNAYLQRVEKFPPASEIPRLLGHESARVEDGRVLATLADDPERAARFDEEARQLIASWGEPDARTPR